MSPPARSGRPERIGHILKERIEALGWEARLREEEAVAGWDTVVGPQIAAHARASHIVNRRLTVVTESPVWTQQLALLKPELLRRIAERFGPQAVADLYFVTGRLDPPEAGPPPPVLELPEDEALPADLQRELDLIPDAHVRESVRQVMRAALAGGKPGTPDAPA